MSRNGSVERSWGSGGLVDAAVIRKLLREALEGEGLTRLGSLLLAVSATALQCLARQYVSQIISEDPYTVLGIKILPIRLPLRITRKTNAQAPKQRLLPPKEHRLYIDRGQTMY